MTRLSIVMLAAALSLASAVRAFAHAHPAIANPPPGSIMKAPPRTVPITLSEALEPRFSSVEVVAAAGQRMDQGAPRAADDAKRFDIGLRPLRPGVYKVMWRVTSVDTHKTSGSYEVTVKP